MSTKEGTTQICLWKRETGNWGPSPIILKDVISVEVRGQSKKLH